MKICIIPYENACHMRVHNLLLSKWGCELSNKVVIILVKVIWKGKERDQCGRPRILVSNFQRVPRDVAVREGKIYKNEKYSHLLTVPCAPPVLMSVTTTTP